jgi:hypothetical protein
MPRCIRVTFHYILINPMTRVKMTVLLGVYVGHGRWPRGRKTM